MIGLLIALAWGTAVALGLGNAGLVAGIVALYLAMGTFDSTLRSDMGLLAVLAVFTVCFAVIPALMHSDLPLVSALLFLLGVFLAGVAPRFWQRSLLFGRSLGFVVVYVYGYVHLGTSSTAEAALAVLVSLILVVIVRLIVGAVDPAGPKRRKLARLLTDPDPERLNTTVYIWLGECAESWYANVLLGSIAVQTSLERARQHGGRGQASGDDWNQFLALEESAAAAVAANVRRRRARNRPDLAAESLEALERHLTRLPQPDSETGRRAFDGLFLANQAAIERDTTPLTEVTLVDRRFLRSVLRGTITRQSEWLRHGLRTTCVFALVLLFIWWQDPGPFVIAMLAGTYGVLYPTWAGSARQVWRNLIGLVTGALVSAIIFVFVPPTWLTPICIAALFVGLTFIASNLSLFYVGLVVALSGLVAPLVDLDGFAYAVHYVGYTAAGAFAGTLVAFALVPAIPMSCRWHRIADARRATADVLDRLVGSREELSQYLPEVRRAFAAQQDAMPVQSLASKVAQLDPIVRAAAALETLNYLSLAILFESLPPSDALEWALGHAAGALRDTEPLAPVDGFAVPAFPESAGEVLGDMVLLTTTRLVSKQ